MISHGTFSLAASPLPLHPPIRGTPALPIAPMAYAHDGPLHGTASTCGTRSHTLRPHSRYPPLSQYTPFCGNATGSAMRNTSVAVTPLQLVPASALHVLSRHLLLSRYPLPTSRYIPLTIAPLAYAQMSPHTILPNAGPALACYVLLRVPTSSQIIPLFVVPPLALL